MIDKNCVLVENWDTWKTNSSISKPKTLLLSSFFPAIFHSHLCDVSSVVRDCVDRVKSLVFECRKWLNSSIQYLWRYRFYFGLGTHTEIHTHAHRGFPLNGYFQQLLAQWGKSSSRPPFEVISATLPSLCYHSIHSSYLSLANPPLPRSSPLCP